MDKINDFKTFVENFLFAYRQFCLNEFLHEKVDSDLYKKYIATWNTLLLSLEADNDVIGRLGTEFGLSENFRQMFNQTREETRNEGDKWLQPFR